MSQPILVDILSDSDSEPCDNRRSLRSEAIDLTTSPPFQQSKKKQKTEEFPNPSHSTVFFIDDGPTPLKEIPPSSARNSSPTPSFVADTPFSDASAVNFAGGRCSISECLGTRPLISNDNFSEIKGWICVDSDDESENIGEIGSLKDDSSVFASKLDETEFGLRLPESSFSCGTVIPNQRNKNACSLKGKKKTTKPRRTSKKKTTKSRRTSKEERLFLMEEKKWLKEQEKLLKAASKAEAAEVKKREKEMKKWEKGESRSYELNKKNGKRSAQARKSARNERKRSIKKEIKEEKW